MPTKGKTTSQKLEAIQARLRKGDFALISELTGYDASHVRRVLLGERTNPSGEIVDEAYRYMYRRKPVK